MHSADAILPERPRIARRLLSWLALLLLVSHLAGGAPRAATIDLPDKPLSIEARPIQAVIAQGRAADIVKAGRVQAPDKPGQGSGDPPLADLAPVVGIPAATNGPVHVTIAAYAIPRGVSPAHRARAPPIA